MKKLSGNAIKKMDTNNSKEILLSISVAISKANSPSELLAIIREKVMKLIPFYDTGILIVENDGLHHYDMAVNFSGWDDHTETNVNLRQQNNLFKVTHPGSYLAYEIDNIEKAQTPIITDWDHVFKNWDHPFFPTMKVAGYRESLVGLLKSEGKTYGTLWLNSLKKNHFKKEQFILFEEITSVVSVAVSNILTNEKILEREREKSVLLEISTAVSQISNRESLFKTIINKIQPIFGFVDAALFIVENDLKNYRLWFDTLNEPYIVNKDNLERSVIPLGNPVINYCLEDKPPRIIEIPLMIELAKSMPSLIAWIEDSGTQETLVGTLKMRGRVIGCFNAHSKVKGKFNEYMLPLYQNVCEQISIAVANIIANEEILEREREKSELLVISEQMATIRKIDDLLSIITIKLKPIFLFDYSVTTVYSEDKKYVMHISSNNSEQERDTENYQHLFGKANPVAETPYEIFLNNELPTIYNIDYYVNNYSTHYGVKILQDLGIVENVIMTLRYAGKILGTLEFHFCKSAIIDKSKLPILQNLSSQVSVALSNILANDEILNREKEKSILLYISRSLAGIRNREDLLKKFVSSLKTIFNFDDAVITLYDASLKTRRYAHAYSGPPKDNLADYNFLHNNVIENNGTPYEEIICFECPQIYSMDYWRKKYKNDPGIKIATEFGLEESLYLPLVYANQLLGTFTLHSKVINNFSQNKLPLYQNLSDQVAIAVANILANEEILDREREKSILLSLSEDLATIRNRQDLWKVMMEKIKPLAGFDDAVVIVFSEDRKLSNTILTISNEERTNKGWYHYIIENWIPVTPPLKYIYNLGTTYWSTVEMLKKWPGFEGFEFMKSEGLTDTYQVLLRHGGKDIGLLLLHFKKNSPISIDKYGLYKSLADQITVAIANILANEEILEREKEKTILLSLSKDFAIVNDRNDLFKIISQKVLPLFDCHDMVVFIADKERDIYYLLLSVAKNNRYENEYFPPLISKALQLKGSLEEWILEHEKVSIIPIVEFITRFPDAPGIKLMKEVGLKDSLIGVLKAGGKIIGSLHLHSENDNHFKQANLHLFESVCDQLSSTIANILANEEILEREKEKSVLLKISSQLSLVNDRKQLWALLSNTLKEIINFNIGIVATLDQGGESFRVLLSTAPKDMDNNPEYKELGTKPEILAGSPFEYIFKKEGVFEFSLKELEGKYPGYLGLKMMREYGLLHTVGIKLANGNDFIGQAYFHFNRIEDIDYGKFGLLKSIGEQLSIVVANILANEQIQTRAKEKSLQIEVVNAITSTKNKTLAFLNLANVINKAIPFHTFSIAFPFDINYLIGFKKNKKGELVVWHNVEEIMEYADIDIEEYQYMLNEIAASGYFSNAHICVGKDHQELCRKFRIFALHNECIGTRSALHLPFLFHGQNITVHIYLNSQEDHGFNEKHLHLLQAMVSPISLAMENLFAFEDIEKREKEKTILLNLSNAINNIKDKEELWEEMVNQLQPVFGFERDFTFLYLITPDRNHYRFFLLNKNALKDQNLAFKDVYLNEFPIKGAPYEEVINKDVWIFAIEDMINNYPNFRGFKQGLESGQKQTAIIRLEHGGKIIGSLHLNSKQIDCFKETQIPLMKAIGKQISMAIANIIATDEIERQLLEIINLKKQLEVENEYLQEVVDVAYNYSEIIGSSKEMQNVFRQVSQVASTDTTVLILGETGTGKELIARAIHNSSSRKDKLLVKVNCASLPANLIESELFGHERGAFTGAFEKRIGKFELANNGTLFLDEIGELPIELQAKLLRALQEKEIERIGGKAIIKCDVRIIAATNRKLDEEVKAQRFRSDLFFRLNIFPIRLPSLKDRKEDVPMLAYHFLQKFSKKMNKKIIGIENDSLQSLMTYQWPGNIRELENVIERAVIINNSKVLKIGLGDLGQQIHDFESSSVNLNIFQVKSYKDAERDLILKTLEISNGKIRGEGGAAQLLKINPTTLESKMKKLGLVKKNKIEIKGD